MMKLSALIAPWKSIEVDCDILGIEQDSRLVKSGDVFFAYSGGTHDARKFISEVLEKGAAAVLYEPLDWPQDIALPTHPLCIPIPELIMKRGEIASRFYDYPTRAFEVMGVTGTNGKTTIAYLLAQAYELLGKSSAYLGTLGQGSVSNITATNNTTPDPLSVQHFFHTSHLNGVKMMCMEVSSHALTQARVAGVDFTYAIYTNLSHEHLDYHKTMDAYAEAKATLFASASLKYAMINQDDTYAETMKASVPNTCQLLTYGIHAACDIRAENIHMNMTGSTFDVVSPWGCFEIKTKLIGQFNIYNSLAVLATLLSSGHHKQEVLHVMQKLKASPGRMEIVHENPCVIVDYAHTPDALENALSTVASLKKRHLWVVFGCGGDRDKTKRPLMGKVASHYADRIILTSDNPRTEDPAKILDEVRAGIINSQDIVVEPDRKQAIHGALAYAHEDDLIIIAGKGHEDYQHIGITKFPFSDQAVVREFYQSK